VRIFQNIFWRVTVEVDPENRKLEQRVVEVGMDWIWFQEGTMSRSRKRHDAGLKARVALEAVKERETVAGLSQRFGVHPTQVNQWKRKLLEEADEIFERESGSNRCEAFEAAELYEPIGRLKMELDWLKKSCPVRRVRSGV
jgi:putative transposase